MPRPGHYCLSSEGEAPLARINPPERALLAELPKSFFVVAQHVGQYLVIVFAERWCADGIDQRRSRQPHRRCYVGNCSSVRMRDLGDHPPLFGQFAGKGLTYR